MSLTNPAGHPIPDQPCPLSCSQARAELRRLRREPVGLSRPLIVLSGWRAPRAASWIFARTIRELTGAHPDDLLPVSFGRFSNFDAMTAHLLSAVRSRWAFHADSPPEVDVVAVSMGGLVARAAASPAAMKRHGSRLRIRTLYTLASPHCGARLARRIALDHAARDMRPGSPFLERLDSALECADYRLVCYARLGDLWVGARNAAPAERFGAPLIWFPALPLAGHLTVPRDPRILADLSRRLRGEAPLACPSGKPPRD